MKSSKLSPWFCGLMGIAALTLPLSPALTRRAHAFGGLWSAEGGGAKQSAERIIFVDPPGPTITAIVQFEYAGPSRKFAWLVPVPGKVSVGISSSVVLDRLDVVTAPHFWTAVDVAGSCMREHVFDLSYDSPSETDTPDDGMPSGPVRVVERGSVGPYDFVHIAPDPTTSDPAAAATAWLTAEGYELTSIDSQVLGPYLRDGLGLLAFKLTKDGDIGAIRPVTLTYESKLPVLPMRPTAVSAKDDLDLEVWVFGPSQAVPENYKALVLNDALIDWSSARKFPASTLPAGGGGPFGPLLDKPRNYDALVTAAANQAAGQGFVTELAGPASRFRSKVWSALDAETFAMIRDASYDDGIAALYAADEYYGGWDGWPDAVAGATTLPAGVTLDAFGRDPSRFRGAARVDTAKFLRLLEEKVVKPVIDAAALLASTPYLTRLHTTMSAGEMTVDPVFNYNYGLDQVSNVQVAQQYVQCSPALLRPEDAPWYMNLPQGGVVVGDGVGWPLALGALPANLKVVALSTEGAGQVTQDNSQEIGAKLFARAGTIGDGTPILRRPQQGAVIGGTQRVGRPVEQGATQNAVRHKSAAPSTRRLAP
ncbi:MAG: DUF2330 domain-containing protein [Polyangiales bacterium]